MLENLNSKKLGYDFKGNPGILNGILSLLVIKKVQIIGLLLYKLATAFEFL
jgi:hypothetical protein